MNDKAESTFVKVDKHLFKRQYRKEDGEWTTLYYALFRDWKKFSVPFHSGQ